MFDLDETITAPLHGFLNAEDYYTQSSCKPFLKKIKIPTLIIHAKDDPFTPPHSIPSKDELSDTIQLEVWNRGGHVGFVSGNYFGKVHYWLEKRVPYFLKKYIK